ncbi:MAG: iron-containing alcohol dehydrogenase [Spirochaetia bacterium]|jgi:alcohol dehydrogenase class IV
MVPFILETPRTIQFGIGALQKLPSLVDGLGKRALLVTGTRWFAESGWRPRISDALGGRACGNLCLPAGEPSGRSLTEAAAAAGRFSPDVLVAVGGGSVIDSAKALSALLRFPGPVERFLEGVPGSVPIPGPGVPWIAVPTTSGTGAEVTKNAVVRSEELGVKRSMRSLHLLASAVVVDPLLTLSLPAEVTGTSGLDALTQLVEAYVSRSTNPFVQSIVEGAIGPMISALDGLPGDPSNETLRAQASYGAMISGMSLANAGLGAAHGFAAAVGGMFGVPHGLACAVFLPHVLAANAPLIREPMTRLLGRVAGAPSGDATEWLGARVRTILAAFGFPADLKAYKIPRDRLVEIAEKSSGSSMRGNPKELSTEERVAILSMVA